jgi:nicotinamide-nucleotide amidase
MLYDAQQLNMIKEELVKRKKTLAVAESVTSGFLQAAFSSANEASRFFQGGLTAYNAGQKSRHLNIEPIYALESNCISESVTEAMAIEISKLFLSHIGIGITGYAAPVPELDVHQVYAYYSISFEGRTVATKKITSHKTDSVDVQLDYTNQVVAAVAQCIKRLPYSAESVTVHP